MLQNYSRYRLLQEFFDSPRKGFYVRELSRKLKLAQISVMNHLKALQSEGFVVREKRSLYPTYRANRENEEYKILKKENIIWRLYKSGLLYYIEENIQPNCIVLFGSASKGEDIETSDIDIFVQANEAELNMKHFEAQLKRKVNLFFEPTTKNLSKELLNNIINGEIIYGYLKVF